MRYGLDETTPSGDMKFTMNLINMSYVCTYTCVRTSSQFLARYGRALNKSTHDEKLNEFVSRERGRQFLSYIRDNPPCQLRITI